MDTDADGPDSCMVTRIFFFRDSSEIPAPRLSPDFDTARSSLFPAISCENKLIIFPKIPTSESIEHRINLDLVKQEDECTTIV